MSGFKPTPTELKEEGWYEWNVENWGTKWNCDAQDWMKVEHPNEDESSVTFWFDSAWSPPIALYEHIELNSPLNVKASYNECGMGFVGEFVDGSDDYYEYDDFFSKRSSPRLRFGRPLNGLYCVFALSVSRRLPQIYQFRSVCRCFGLLRV